MRAPRWSLSVLLACCVSWVKQYLAQSTELEIHILCMHVEDRDALSGATRRIR